MESQVHDAPVLIHAEVAAELWPVRLWDHCLFDSQHLMPIQEGKLLSDLIHSLSLNARQPWVLVLRHPLVLLCIVVQLIEGALLDVLPLLLLRASLLYPPPAYL